MNKVNITLWNRKFDLPVSYSCYLGEQITQKQQNIVSSFCEQEVPANGALVELKKYVMKNSDGKVQEGIDNIFKYVIPKSLYVPRSNEATIAVLCDFKFDMENGIAIVFENGKLKKIGTQDIIL